MKCCWCREVLLAVSGDNVKPDTEADAGGPLGPDHEGHGEAGAGSWSTLTILF